MHGPTRAQATHAWCVQNEERSSDEFDVWSEEKRRKDTSSDSRNNDSDGEPTTAASDDEQLTLSDSKDDELDPVNTSTYNGAVSVVDDCCDCTTVCCSEIQQAYQPREKIILSFFIKRATSSFQRGTRGFHGLRYVIPRRKFFCAY